MNNSFKDVQTVNTVLRQLEETRSLGVVDLARPGISRGWDGRGSIAANVIRNGAVGLDLRTSVGRDLDRARPVAGEKTSVRVAINLTREELKKL